MRPPFLIASLCLASAAMAQQPIIHPIHDMERPRPPVVAPGAFAPGFPAPSDAIVLIGNDLSAWEGVEGGPAAWSVGDGFVEVAPGAGNIRTRQRFGDVQLHLEWAAPAAATGSGQDRGNSGLFFMSTYEVQILDSYQSDTYPDGQAAAVYGQYPPLVNAARPPGQWQTYDAVFRRPHFDAEGTLVRPATLTLFHNGVLVQDKVALVGPTSHSARTPYAAHADALPFVLQDHGHLVRFRNMWVRNL